MVFITGPRQCGKTTLAKKLAALLIRPKDAIQYLNWDYPQDRQIINRGEWPAGAGILILDEIHKNRRWRNIVKGLFDKRGEELKIMVLDLYSLSSAKLTATKIHRGLEYLKARFPDVEAIQIVQELSRPFKTTNDILVTPAAVYLKKLV